MIRTHMREGEIAKYNTLKVIQTLCFYKFFNNLGSLRSGDEWQGEDQEEKEKVFFDVISSVASLSGWLAN